MPFDSMSDTIARRYPRDLSRMPRAKARAVALRKARRDASARAFLALAFD